MDDADHNGKVILAQLRAIADDAARSTRRLLAGDLAQFDIDRQAFDAAVDAFDSTVFAAPRAVLPSDREEMFRDGQLGGLEAFLRTYLIEAAR